MLRKRIIGVVTIKQGWVVQSFGYTRYLPVGKIECILENLDRWGIDEILLQVIDRSDGQLGPDFRLLEKISELGLSTPVTYAGGIRNEKDATAVIKTGADRISIDSLLIDNVNEIKNISYRLGAQAIVASMPMAVFDRGAEWFDYRSSRVVGLSSNVKYLFESDAVSEILLIDKENEGSSAGFNVNLLGYFKDISTPIIAFGGINDSEQMLSLLKMDCISAVAIGNSLNYKEHSLQNYKLNLNEISIRPEVYRSSIEVVSE